MLYGRMVADGIMPDHFVCSIVARRVQMRDYTKKKHGFSNVTGVILFALAGECIFGRKLVRILRVLCSPNTSTLSLQSIDILIMPCNQYIVHGDTVILTRVCNLLEFAGLANASIVL